MRKYFINLVIAVACALAVFLIGFSVGLARSSFTAPPAQEAALGPDGPTTAMALLINDGKYVKSYTGLPVPQPPTVLALLEYSSERQSFFLDVDKSSSMGAFVKQIGDKANGQQSRYWQYYVNGSQPPVASDRYILQGGETVLWTFSKSER